MYAGPPSDLLGLRGAADEPEVLLGLRPHLEALAVHLPGKIHRVNPKFTS